MDRLRARGYEFDEDGNTIELGYGETAKPWQDPMAEAARDRVMALTGRQRRAATRLTVWCDEGCALVKVSSTTDGLLIHAVGENLHRLDRGDERDDEAAAGEPKWDLAPAVFVDMILSDLSRDSPVPFAYSCSCKHSLVAVDLRMLALLTQTKPDTLNVRWSEI